MVNWNYDAKILKEREYKEKVYLELKKGSEMTGLLLLHGYIEAYLLEIIFYSGKMIKKNLTKKAIESIERISFHNLLHVNLLTGNISFDLYKKIQELNKKRNNTVHGLLGIKSDKKTKDKIRKLVKQGIKLCDDLFSIYMDKLNEKSRQLEVENNA